MNALFLIDQTNKMVSGLTPHNKITLSLVSAESSVSVGDRIGWGVIWPVSEQKKKVDQLIICYLCINLKVVLTRVIFQPPGGVYPVIILPNGGK